MSETVSMNLDDVTPVHIGRHIRVAYDHPFREGTLTDIRREERPLDDVRLTGPGGTRETFVTVQIDGQWLPEVKGRLVPVELLG